jgi:uncharacterized OB-fold protein
MTVPAAACRACERVVAPPRDRCPGCGETTERTDLAPEGELLTWTVLRSPPAGQEVDRVVGVVALGEGARALALGPEEEQVPGVGASVVVEEGADGRLRFRAADR